MSLKEMPCEGRRKFIGTVTKATGAALFLSQPFISMAEDIFRIEATWAVGDVMDKFIKEVPGAPFEKTVDTLKSGSRDINITGIVTTMFATVEVIQKAVELHANFIIAHEPSFYNHLDETKWLEHDEVYQYKSGLLEKNNIALWRNHDYIHRLQADGVMEGVLTQLQWKKYYSDRERGIVSLSSLSLKQLIQHVKAKLGITQTRYIGDLSQPCKRILLMPGAAGGKSQIEGIGNLKPDVLICGELLEWETAEYV